MRDNRWVRGPFAKGILGSIQTSAEDLLVPVIILLEFKNLFIFKEVKGKIMKKNMTVKKLLQKHKPKRKCYWALSKKDAGSY